MIGSGWDIIDRVPKEGKAAFETIYNTIWSNQPVAHVEIWAAPSILSDFD